MANIDRSIAEDELPRRSAAKPAIPVRLAACGPWRYRPVERTEAAAETASRLA